MADPQQRAAVSRSACSPYKIAIQFLDYLLERLAFKVEVVQTHAAGPNGSNKVASGTVAIQAESLGVHQCSGC
jgi:hypothetical protein